MFSPGKGSLSTVSQVPGAMLGNNSANMANLPVATRTERRSSITTGVGEFHAANLALNCD